MRSINLLENWRLRDEELSCGPEMAAIVSLKQQDWMEVPSLPCDVHMALVDAGRIEDPNVGSNTFACQWVERRSWWFRKTFTLNAADLKNFGAELFVEILDIHADLYLNGCHIGHHASAFYPFCKDVSPWLLEGENTLLIRLTTGLEQVDQQELEPVRDFVACEWRRRREGRGDERRACLRKPQHVFGWDQSPRLATCAIDGDVRLDILDEVVVRDIRFETLELTDAGARILAEAEVESRERIFARECAAVFTVEKDGQVVYEKTHSYLSQTGSNFLNFSFVLPNPELWWPNGYGAQPLYTVRVKASNHNGARDEKSITTAIRTVRLDETPINEAERKCCFVVNGKPIYCKGMDLIHTDILYARATQALEEKVLQAALDGHFTMLRFWDGSFCYRKDYVYDFCDRHGILIHQDFAFSCSAYPDHVPAFRELVREEALYQLRRLRNHPSIALWCGCGETLGLLHNFLNQNYFTRENPAIRSGGTDIMGKILPQLHHQMVASVGYQCCTPFGGFFAQQTPKRGDCHTYPFLNYAPEYQQTRISFEVIDTLDAKFMSEGGIMGPPSAEALLQACGGAENTAWDSPVLEHHRNTFERWAVRDGIYRHYTGEKNLTLEEYCLYGGMFQSSLLGYQADHMRSLEHCDGCVLWCLTDGYGEVGFSILDRLGNPKPAYYAIRRAYSPKRLILKRNGEEAVVYCSNDSDQPEQICVTCGYVTFDGAYAPPITLTAVLPAFCKRMEIGRLSLEGLDLAGGVVYAQAEDPDILTATMHSADFRTLQIAKKATLTISDAEKQGSCLSFTVSADGFAHGVHFGVSEAYCFNDLYFDLLPGEKRRITISNAEALTAADLKPDCVFVK